MKHSNKMNTHKRTISFKTLPVTMHIPVCYFPKLSATSSPAVTTILNFVSFPKIYHIILLDSELYK